MALFSMQEFITESENGDREEFFRLTSAAHLQRIHAGSNDTTPSFVTIVFLSSPSSSN